MSVSHQSVLLSASCTFHPLLHCAACRSVSLQPVPVLLSARVIDPSQNPNVREIRKFFKSLKFLYKKKQFFYFPQPVTFSPATDVGGVHRYKSNRHFCNNLKQEQKLHWAACRPVSLQPVPVLLSARHVFLLLCLSAVLLLLCLSLLCPLLSFLILYFLPVCSPTYPSLLSPTCLSLLAPVILFISCLHTRPPALLLDSQTFLTLYLLPVCYSKSLLSALPPVAVISCLLPTVCPSCLHPPPTTPIYCIRFNARVCRLPGYKAI